MNPINDNLVPEHLTEHAGGLTVMEVSADQHKVAMRKFAGVFFGKQIEDGRYYIKGTKKDTDYIRDNYS
jgi:hypothetical protein